jgi:Holliday junction DNA helicase RuvA
VYEYLEGEIAGQAPARLIVAVGGVGYTLSVPLGSRFPAAGKVRAWTHLVVREDSHTLYGFADRETRELFRVLLSVRGVGPVMALAILSGLSRDALLEAIAGGDLKTLTRVRGVGRKTGEQILLDLRDKAAELVALLAGPKDAHGVHQARRGDPREKNVEDAVAALTSIGYSEKEARKHVERAAQAVNSGDLELLVRTALSS